MVHAEVEQRLERILEHLRSVMRQRKFSQVAVQKTLGWKGSYISQLFNRTKSLRVEQLLQILAVIGYCPLDFFDEVYGVQKTPVTLKPDHEAIVSKMQEHLQGFGTSLVKLLNSEESEDTQADEERAGEEHAE